MPEYMAIQEAVAKGVIGRTAVYRLIRLGLLTRHKTPVDRRTYIDLEELRELRRNPPMKPAEAGGARGSHPRG